MTGAASDPEDDQETGGEASRVPQRVVVSKRLAAINGASSVVSRLLDIFVLAWMYQYLLDRIPAEEFAVYPVVTAIMVFAPLFFSFFTGGISRHVVDAYARGDGLGVRTIISSVFPLLATASAVFLIAGIAFGLNIERVLKVPPEMVDEAHLMTCLLIASYALQMLLLPFGAGYHVRQKFVELNALTVARSLLRMSLLLVLLLGVGPNIIWVVTAGVVSDVLYQVVVLVRSRRMLPELRFEWGLFDWAKARDLMSFGLWTTVGRLGAIMYTSAATIVLNLYGSAIDVTSYFIGATLFRHLEGMIGMAVMPLQPALTAMNAMTDKARLARTVLRGGRYGLWASMAVAAPLAIFSTEFTALYLEPRYSEASVVIFLFMIIFPFTQATVLLPLTSMATARVREFFLPAFLFQLLGLILMLIFAAEFKLGAVGVTLALTIITIGSQLTYFWVLLLKITEARFRTFCDLVLVRGLLPTVGGSVVWCGLKLAFPVDSWFQLGLFSVLGGLVYLAVLFRFCLDTGEQRDLRAGLERMGLRRVGKS